MTLTHPRWCVRSTCSADDPERIQAHRSAPIVIPTSDAGVALYVSALATPDVDDVSIELVELKVPFVGPFYEAPTTSRLHPELVLSRTEAIALCRALLQLQRTLDVDRATRSPRRRRDATRRHAWDRRHRRVVVPRPAP
jgi:hypothetical protein